MKVNLFKTAGLIAFLTILSKIVGFARDLFIANAYGATTVSDSYFYAYQIPALALILLGGMGGPFHSATVAFFTKNISDISCKIPENSLKIFNSFVTASALVFGILAILVFIFPEQILNVIAAKASPDLVVISSQLLKIMSPVILIGGIIGIFYGISVVYKNFFVPSLSPIFMSSSIIIALALFPHDPSGKVLAYGFLVGAIAQFSVQLIPVIKNGLLFKPNLGFLQGDVDKISEVLFPAILGSTIGQINIYIDMFFTSGLQEGAWSAISYSNRLFQFPTGVIVTAFLVPLFPMFSTFVGKKDWGSLKEYFHKGINTLWFLAFPIFVFILLFAQDAIFILFQRGAFDSQDTLMVTEALLFLSISIIPYVARDTLTRVFYSFDDSRTPFFVALASISVKMIMNFLLVERFGIAGVTTSTAIVAFFNMGVLAFLLRQKIALNYREFIVPMMKIALASVVVFCVGFSLKNSFIFETKMLVALKLFVIFIICSSLYIALSFAMKVPATQEILLRIKKN